MKLMIGAMVLAMHIYTITTIWACWWGKMPLPSIVPVWLTAVAVIETRRRIREARPAMGR